MATDYITAKEFARVASLPIDQQKAYLAARSKAFKNAQKFIAGGFTSGDGAQVILSRIPGLTQRGLLPRRFHFQVPPQDSITISHSFTHTDYETIGGQQFSQPNSHALSTVNLSGMMLPDTDISYGVYHYADPATTQAGTQRETGFAYASADALSTPTVDENSLAYGGVPPDPLEAAAMLLQLMASGTPFYLIIHQNDVWDRSDFNAPVTLRTLGVEQRAGEPTTRYVDLAFTEYRRAGLLGRKTDPSTFHRDLPTWVTLYEDGHGVSSEKRTLGSSSQPLTLSLLAQTYYGSASKWRLIAQAPQNREWRGLTPNTALRSRAKKYKGVDRIYIPKAPKTTGAKGKGSLVSNEFLPGAKSSAGF